MGQKPKFDYDAGAMCLDFANTIEWSASENPDDLIENYQVLLEWAEGAGIVDETRSRRLLQMSNEQPRAAERALNQAVGVRDAIYHLFAAISQDGSIPQKDLEQINKNLSDSLAHLQIAWNSEGFSWQWKEQPANLSELIWPITRSAADLLVSEQLNRVKQCADDRGCGYLFIDTSRNRSRRWCSMESCGNRAKVLRHYHKNS